MARLVSLTLAVAIAGGINFAGAQTSGRASSKVQGMTGKVKAVSASSLILEQGGNEITFSVDSATRVLAAGTRRGDLVYRQPRRLDGVKVGDRVTVRYRQSGKVMNALEVRVAPR